MIDVPKQVAYWRDGAQEDWAVARELVDRGRNRHGLFFAHLALEKILKAHVCAKTQDVAPRVHNLVRLAEQAGLALNDDQRATLADVNVYTLAGRYPEMLPPEPQDARALLNRAGKVFTWLLQKS